MTFLRTVLAIVLLNLPLHAQPNPTASDAWAQMSGSAVAVYATVKNPSMYDVYIVSAKSDAAANSEILNGEKPVTSIIVPAYGSAELKPGAMFVRLSELKGELKAGDEVKVTLETDGGVSIEIAAVIK
jgi:copper(I)-binding protein